MKPPPEPDPPGQLQLVGFAPEAMGTRGSEEVHTPTKCGRDILKRTEYGKVMNGIMTLPVWRVDTEKARSWSLEFSLVSQMDGLMFKLFGLRIERDVFAASASQSCCKFFGCNERRPWSTFTGTCPFLAGWWFNDATFVGIFQRGLESMPQVIATAASHHACGLFVVPCWKGTKPLLQKGKVAVPWVEFVEANAMLTFHLPKNGFRYEC